MDGWSPLHLLFILLGQVCLSAMIAYLMGRDQSLYRVLASPPTLKTGLVLTAIFSSLSVVASYYGVRIHGGLASTRVVGTLMGGLAGGPWVGLAVGLISGLHRYLLGGFTASSCAAATVIAGCLAGLVRTRYGFDDLNWKIATAVALAAEFLQKGLTLAFAKPFGQALAFEKLAAVPTTAATVAGTVLFILILQDMRARAEAAGAHATRKALSAANGALPFLKDGLTPTSARKIAAAILKNAHAAAVEITGLKGVLAYEGLPCPAHRPGRASFGPGAEASLNAGEAAGFAGDHGCGDPDCPLRGGIATPLVVNGEAAGAVRFYYAAKRDGISAPDTEMLVGIGRYLSTCIALADYKRQKAMLEAAEQRALESEISPHFLFNTLSIIGSLCRTNPELARRHIEDLSGILRFSFAHHEPLIPLGEEYGIVRSYLSIVGTRFGPRLNVEEHIDAALMGAMVPAFILQPLVENAVTHGLFPKTDDCALRLDIFKEPGDGPGGRLVIRVADNGAGMSPDRRRMVLDLRSEGIGLANVVKRLKSLYRGAASFELDGAEGRGTVVTLKIPLRNGGQGHEIPNGDR